MMVPAVTGSACHRAHDARMIKIMPVYMIDWRLGRHLSSRHGQTTDLN